MHFITVSPTRDEETGQLHGCRIRLRPLLSNNLTTGKLYCELWHRLRRNNVTSHAVDKTVAIFDAGLFIKGSPGGEVEDMDAAIIVNTARKAKNFRPTIAEADSTTTAWLQYMDSLLVTLFADADYAARLHSISQEFQSLIFTPKDENEAKTRLIGLHKADEDLKIFLKDFCRAQGLYIDEDDAKRVRAERKAARRQAFEADVKAGRVQIPQKGTKRRP